MFGSTGIIEIDLHGSDYETGLNKVEDVVRKADRSVYRIRVIHGYHGGNMLRRMLQEEFQYGRSEKVLRIQGGTNPGLTELILREY